MKNKALKTGSPLLLILAAVAAFFLYDDGQTPGGSSSAGKESAGARSTSTQATGAQTAGSGRATNGSTATSEASSASRIDKLFRARTSGEVVEIEGRVERLLRDDNEGSRHQKFILSLGPGRTVLVSHNIDLAKRVPADEGDRVELRGQYEWNDRGGVVHWTHHDPGGRRPGGWIRHDGKTYR